MLWFDHVIFGTSDMDAAARRWRDEFGLDSLAGGRHRGQGTGNRIVPLGPDYLELMAIVDAEEASRSEIGRWLRETVQDGDRLFAWCLRTDEIDDLSARLDLTPVEWTRERPDGSLLKWRLAGLERSRSDPSLPFFIQWDIPDEMHPGRGDTNHSVVVAGMAWIEVAGDPAAIAESLGDGDLDVRVVTGGTRGVRAVGVKTHDDDLVIS